MCIKLITYPYEKVEPYYDHNREEFEKRYYGFITGGNVPFMGENRTVFITVSDGNTVWSSTVIWFGRNVPFMAIYWGIFSMGSNTVRYI